MDRKNSQAITRIVAFVALCAAVGATACSSDSIALPRTDAQGTVGSTGGTDTSSNHTPPTTPTPPTPPTPPVSSFNLTLTVAGSVAGADSSVHDPLAGVSVEVTRVMSVRGDTLNPSVPAGTIVTDAHGVGTLSNLPGGYYTFLATPPAGSPYVKSSFGLGAPTSSDVNVHMVLRRAP